VPFSTPFSFRAHYRRQILIQHADPNPKLGAMRTVAKQIVGFLHVALDLR
jgi:hypothetical protein